MDDLLTDFIELNYTQELGQELLRALQIFDQFNYIAIYERVNNIIMDAHNQDKNEVTDSILLYIKEGQDWLFRAHKIEINPEAPIGARNELLVALALFMRLEDYGPSLSVLYSMESDMDIFTSIFCDLCMLDQVQMYDLVADFSPDLLGIMKKYAEGKSKEEDYEDIGRERTSILETLDAFKTLYGANALGIHMLKAGTLPNVHIDAYYPYIKNDLIDPNSIPQTALNILSVVLMSSNGHNAPIITYKKYIDKYTDSLELVQKLEPIILKMLTEIENYKRAKNEQKRIPEISNQG